MRIRSRLILSFLVVASLGSIAGAVGYLGMQSSNRGVARLQRITGFALGVHETAARNAQLRRYEADIFLAIGDPKAQDEAIALFEAATISAREALDAVVETFRNLDVVDPAADQAINQSPYKFKAYLTGARMVFGQLKADPSITPQAADRLMADFVKESRTLEANFRILVQAATALSDGTSRLLAARFGLFLAISLLALGGSLILSLAFGALFSVGIARPVRAMAAALKDVS